MGQQNLYAKFLSIFLTYIYIGSIEVYLTNLINKYVMGDFCINFNFIEEMSRVCVSKLLQKILNKSVMILLPAFII